MLENIKHAFARFYKHKYIIIQLAITALLQGVLWLYLLANIRLYTDSTFLHYTVGVGVDLVGSRLQVFALPVIGLCAALANTVLAYTMFRQARMTSFFLVTLTNIIHVFLVISAILTVSLNA